MSKKRNRLSKHNTLEEGIAILEGRRQSLARGRYYNQAKQINFVIAMCHCLKTMEAKLIIPENETRE